MVIETIIYIVSGLLLILTVIIGLYFYYKFAKKAAIHQLLYDNHDRIMEQMKRDEELAILYPEKTNNKPGKNSMMITRGWI